MISALTMVFGLLTKVILAVIAGGLLWTVGRRLWARWRHRPKDD